MTRCPSAESGPGLRTSCFHSRSECSRANSRETSSRLPIRFTATRKASSALQPALPQVRDLVAQVMLQLVDVGRADGRWRWTYPRQLPICASSSASAGAGTAEVPWPAVGVGRSAGVGEVVMRLTPGR